MFNLPNPGSSNYDPESSAQPSRSRGFHARFEGTLIVVAVLIVLLVVLSVVVRLL